MLTSSPARRAGLLVPLFSMPSSRSWGIGEIGDLPAMARWMATASLRVLQLLPINEMPAHDTSPYSALSAMAIDPHFISLADLEDFTALGGEAGLTRDVRVHLEAVRGTSVIEYAAVRALKGPVLRLSFDRFLEHEWRAGSPRAVSLQTYQRDHAWWLDEYALFRALHARYGGRPWTEWPESLRDRQAEALAAARVELADEMLFRQYLQWVAGEQWASARRACGAVAIFGDVPFMVSGDSADVWSRQGDFRLDTSVGVPPDAFSDTGQNWNFPAYRWDVVSAGGYGWLRDRARRNAELFDGYRVDHVVGFYRTYFRALDGTGGDFTPDDQAAQLTQGEQVLGVLREPGAEVVAEDLGVIPDFVRESLVRQAIAGYKVFRWERDWNREGQPFLDPAGYLVLSVATSGTHDTEPMAMWWRAAAKEERAAVLAIPLVQERLSPEACARALESPALSEAVRDVLIETLYASGSDLLILPMQDIFGWDDRINQPATISESNWTWRLPWPVDRLGDEPDAAAVAARLREWATRHRRSL